MEKIIEKIHHDINTAYLERFQQCSEIIDRESVQSDKFDIAKLGFKSYKSEISKSEKIKASKDYIEVVNRLKIDYPYKKFISYDQLGSILEKYPLVLDTPERFIGKIPDNNIKDILNFKLKDIDEGYNPVPNIISNIKANEEFGRITSIVQELLGIFIRDNSLAHFSSERSGDRKGIILNILKEKHGELVNEIIRNIGFQGSYCKSSFTIKNYYYKVERGSFSSAQLTQTYSLLNSDYIINVYPSIHNTTKPSFWILATPDQFDIKSSEIVVGGCIKEVGQGDSLILLKDDPIIFKPIKEGLIVVTQWGAEASLPEFNNSNNN